MAWVTFGEIIRTLGPVATAGAACFATTIAYRGLNKWRAETIGKRKAELAEEVIADFYKARDIVNAARSPVGFSVGEGNTRPKKTYETEDDTNKLNAHYVVMERLLVHREFFAHLQARRYRFIAQFGVDATKPYSDLAQILKEIQDAVQMFFSSYGTPGRPQHDADQRKWRTTIFDGSEEENIRGRLDTIVKAIEATCRPAIRETVR